MYVPKSRFDLPKDAPPYMSDLMTQLRNELKNISQSVASSTGTTLIISGASTAVSGGSSTPIASSNVKAGTQIVTAATDTWVPFPQAFNTTPTVTLCAICATDGSMGLVNIQNLTVTNAGFHIPSADIMVSGNVFYIAVLNG